MLNIYIYQRWPVASKSDMVGGHIAQRSDRPGPLWGRVLAVFGRMLAILGRSWASAGGPGPPLGPPQAVLAALGRIWKPMLAILGRSWTSTGGPGLLLKPMLTLLSRSWGQCGQPGAEIVKSVATLKTYIFLEWERDPRPGGQS